MNKNIKSDRQKRKEEKRLNKEKKKNKIEEKIDINENLFLKFNPQSNKFNESFLESNLKLNLKLNENIEIINHFNPNELNILDYKDIKLIDTLKPIEMELYNKEICREFILIIDFKKTGGGTSVFLNSLIKKYKDKIMFVIIRNMDDIYSVTINDEYLYANEIDVDYFFECHRKKIKKIFVNHINGHNMFFFDKLKNLNIKMSYITHDFSPIYILSTPTYNGLVEENEIKKENQLLNYFDIIITQNIKNLNILNRFIDSNKKIIITDMPDFKKSLQIIETNNQNKIVIGIIGIIHKVKGLKILYMLNNLLNKFNIEFIVFGSIYDKIDKVNRQNIKSEKYDTINDFNNLLEKYKPNLILELSLCPETYSYSLTLAILTKLPILSLKKNMDSVIEDRLSKYENVYYFSTIFEILELIFKHNQNYFYTIDSNLHYNNFWENYFS